MKNTRLFSKPGFLFVLLLTGLAAARCNQDILEEVHDFRANRAPIITSFLSDPPASDALLPSMSFTITVEAHDPDDNPITFSYADNGNIGAFNSQIDTSNTSSINYILQSSLQIGFKAAVTVIITDSKGASTTQTLNLGSGKLGPAIEQLQASATRLYLSPTGTATINWKANSNGYYQISVLDDINAECTIDNGAAFYKYFADTEKTITVNGPGIPTFPYLIGGVNQQDKVCVMVIDALDQSTSLSVVFTADSIAPASTAASDPATIDYTLSSISLTCSDANVDKIAYTINGTDPDFDANGNITSGTLYTGSITTFPDSPTLDVKYRCIDLAGNKETVQTSNYNRRLIKIFEGTTEVANNDSKNWGTIVTQQATAKTYTYTIQNAGQASLNLQGALTVGGANPGEFTVTQPAGTTIAPGSSQTFTIGFKPTTADPKTAQLTIPSNDPLISSFSLNLQGTGYTIAGIAGYYPFSGNANDASGNGRHGTVNSATLTTDKNGNTDNAYRFNGSDQWIDAGYDYSRNVVEAFSFSVWLRTVGDRATDANQVAFGIIDTIDPNPYEYCLSVYRGSSPVNDLNFVYFTSGGSSSLVIRSADNTPIISSGEWYHVVITYDGGGIGGGIGRLYLNGQEIVVSDHPLSTFISQDYSLNIGRGTYGPSSFGYFKGTLDEFRIYTTELSPADVQVLYNSY